jgi:hypothetical protein
VITVSVECADGVSDDPSYCMMRLPEAKAVFEAVDAGKVP